MSFIFQNFSNFHFLLLVGDGGGGDTQGKNETLSSTSCFKDLRKRQEEDLSLLVGD